VAKVMKQAFSTESLFAIAGQYKTERAPKQ